MRTKFTALSALLLLGGCAVLPEPLTPNELAELADASRDGIASGQEPVTGPITLYGAMSRAIKFNLDHEVEIREAALRERQLLLAHYSMLPTAVINAGFGDRDNHSGGSSARLPIGTGVIGADTPSTSSERDVLSSDLALSWNILDFGLSYIRARQTADKVLIARENRQKAVNRIIENVRSAYWRAVTGERLIQKLRTLEYRVVRALSNTRQLAIGGSASPLTALTYERELVEIQREIQRLSGDLGVAKTQLAALMNVEPGTRFQVAVPRLQPAPRYIGLSADDMVNRALEARPELREVAYDKRINRAEARAAMLELLPSVSASLAPNWNSNTFLFNQNWVSWGAKASWNLLKVFSYRAREAEIAARGELLDARSLAVTMAIMTQVHVSRARLIHGRRQYRTALRFHDVQLRILRQIRTSLAAGKVSEQTAIREEMNTLVARVKLDLAYVELQNAYANTFASMGHDPFADLIEREHSVGEMAGALRAGWYRLGDRHGLRPASWFTRTRATGRKIGEAS